MRLIKNQQLFFGCKIDSKLREALAQAKPGDRRYFEDPDGEFLRVLSFEDERWIGKVVKGGLQVTDVEDIQRNVVSILRRVAAGLRTSPSSIKIFVVADDNKDIVDIPPTAEESAGHDEPPPDSGPYIDFP